MRWLRPPSPKCPGWEHFLQSRRAALGTARHAGGNTDVRTASGWLSARRPVTFMAGRKKSLGTVLLSRFDTMVRAASGWLSARPSQIFPHIQDAALGTARRFVKSTDVRTASGWLSVRRPVTFMAGRGVFPGTGFFPRFKSMVRATSGVLWARPSQFSNNATDAGLGTARRAGAHAGARAASGWLSARAPDAFSATDDGSRRLPPAGFSVRGGRVDAGGRGEFRHRRHARRRRAQRGVPASRRHRARHRPRSGGSRARAREAGGLRRAFFDVGGEFFATRRNPGDPRGAQGRRPVARSRGFLAPARFGGARLFVHAGGSARHADGAVQPAHRGRCRQRLERGGSGAHLF